MPGAWEERSKSVLVGILHTDITTIAWAVGFRELMIPGKVCFPSGMPYDHGRNSICMQALDGGFDYCFMMDSDIVAPRDAILRLMAHDKPLISGLYCRRSPPVGIPVMIRNGQWVTDYIKGSVIEVDVVGSGCMLIRRDLLQNMPAQRPGKHWFSWNVDMKGILPMHECLSEDFTFCQAVRKTMGIPTLVDTSIVCKHIGLAESTYGRLDPLNVVAVN